ncbi:MAG: helix-turn-helix domain-containing protein [Chloroflexota bacterium]
MSNNDVDATNAGMQSDIERRVLEAAKELFLHYGYDKTTMKDIADKAGVAKSTIYVRWNKKELLFDTLIWRESSVYLEDWFQRIEADPKGGTYGGWMRHAISAFFENPFLRQLYKGDQRVIGSMLQRRDMAALFTQRQQMMMGFFQQMQAAGAVRKDIDAQTLTYLMNSLRYGLIHMVDIIPDEQSPPMESALTMMAEMLERFVEPEGGGDSEAGKRVLRDFMSQMRQFLAQFEESQDK